MAICFFRRRRRQGKHEPCFHVAHRPCPACFIAYAYRNRSAQVDAKPVNEDASPHHLSACTCPNSQRTPGNEGLACETKQENECKCSKVVCVQVQRRYARGFWGGLWARGGCGLRQLCLPHNAPFAATAAQAGRMWVLFTPVRRWGKKELNFGNAARSIGLMPIPNLAPERAGSCGGQPDADRNRDTVINRCLDLGYRARWARCNKRHRVTTCPSTPLWRPHRSMQSIPRVFPCCSRAHRWLPMGISGRCRRRCRPPGWQVLGKNVS